MEENKLKVVNILFPLLGSISKESFQVDRKLPGKNIAAPGNHVNSPK